MAQEIGVREVMEQLSARVSRVETAIGEIRGEMTGLRGEMTGLRGEITGLRGEMTGLRGDIYNELSRLRIEIQTNFRWTVGILLAIWVSTLGAFVALVR